MHDPVTTDQIVMDCLSAYGIEPTQDEINHMRVLIQAFGKYREREEDYGALWKDSGWRNNLTQLESKAARMGVTKKDAVFHDSAIDAINYSVFATLNRDNNREHKA